MTRLALLLLCGCVTRPLQILEDPEAILGASKKASDAIESLREELTPEQEHYLGRSVAARLLHAYAYRVIEGPDLTRGELGPLQRYVGYVGNVVAAMAVDAQKGDRPLPLGGFRFVVLDSPEVNAFSAPGGYVFITTGAIRAAADEDQLACVLAHEIAHIVRGHGLGAVKQARTANLSREVMSRAAAELAPAELASLTQAFSGALDDVFESTTRGYTEQTELEADARALDLVGRAGYDPHAMPLFLQAALGGNGPGPAAVAGYPRVEQRIAAVQARLASVPPVEPSPVLRDRFLAATAALQAD